MRRFPVAAVALTAALIASARTPWPAARADAQSKVAVGVLELTSGR